MATVGSISVEAVLNDTKFTQGVSSMVSEMNKVETKGKDFNGVLNESAAIMGVIAGATAAAVLAVGDFFKQMFLNSPAFKAFWGEMQVPLFELSDYLGEKLSPLLDIVGERFQEFVNWMTTDKTVGTLIDGAVKVFQNLNQALIDVKAAWDGLPDGLKKALTEPIEKGAEAAVKWITEPTKTAEETVGTGKSIINDIRALGGNEPAPSYVDLASKNKTIGTALFGQNEAGVGFDLLSILFPPLLAAQGINYTMQDPATARSIDKIETALANFFSTKVR